MFNTKSVHIASALEQAEKLQLLDTSVVQIRSVIQFMEALSYHFNYTTGYFETEVRAVKHISKLSFNTAVRLHNMGYVPSIKPSGHYCWQAAGAGFRTAGFIDLIVSPELMAVAQANKIVKEAKIQKDRKGNIHVQSVLVKFANEDFARRYSVLQD